MATEKQAETVPIAPWVPERPWVVEGSFITRKGSREGVGVMLLSLDAIEAELNATAEKLRQATAALEDQAARLQRMCNAVDDDQSVEYLAEHLGDLLHNAVVANDAALASIRKGA